MLLALAPGSPSESMIGQLVLRQCDTAIRAYPSVRENPLRSSGDVNHEKRQ